MVMDDEGRRTSGELARRLRQRIDRAYGGNQRAFAAATGLTPQHVYAMLTGKIALPRPEVRRVLARELGITHAELLVLAGELGADEVETHEIALPPEERELLRLYEDLSPSGREALLAVTRELMRQAQQQMTDGPIAESPASLTLRD